MSNIFELASRQKLTFESSKGLLNIYDIWELPLSGGPNKANLDDLAKGLFKQLQDAETPSFVKPVTNKESAAQLRLDIVKHVIAVKLAERDAAEKEVDRRARKEFLQQVIAEKQTSQLKEKSIAELEAELQALS